MNVAQKMLRASSDFSMVHRTHRDPVTGSGPAGQQDIRQMVVVAICGAD
jgi:hypothetical protein